MLIVDLETRVLHLMLLILWDAEGSCRLLVRTLLAKLVTRAGWVVAFLSYSLLLVVHK